MIKDKEKVAFILQWASKNRAEDGFDKQAYYWTQQTKNFVEFNLKIVSEGLLAGVMGYSGQGKTALRYMIMNEMTPFYEERFPKVRVEDGTTIRDYIPRVTTIKWDTDFHKRFQAQMAGWFVNEKFEKRKLVLIDTPDYGRKDIRLINRDLTQIAKFWSDLRARGYMTNVVIFLQKELVKSQQHFFLLKMDPLLELNPLKSEELLDAYKLKWSNYDPFTEEGLGLIAESSRGIFRRFMRYIRLTVQDILQKNKSVVDVEDVKTVITDDVLIKDSELEFTEMFKNRKYEEYAVKILKFLRENKITNQKTIADALGIHETILSRILTTLEDNRYVKRTRGEGKTFNVEIL